MLLTEICYVFNIKAIRCFFLYKTKPIHVGRLGSNAIKQFSYFYLNCRYLERNTQN